MLANKDSTVLIPLTTAQRLFKDKEFDALYISASSPDAVDAAQDATDDFLIRELGDDDDYSIINQNVIIDVMNDVMSVMTILLSGIAAISLVVGGIGIMNIMLVSVTERTREIGIRKALGAKERYIMQQFVIEAATTSALGGVLGIIVGYGLSSIATIIITALMEENLAVTPSVGAVLGAFGVSTFIGIVFGYLPAKKAARLNPIDALHYD